MSDLNQGAGREEGHMERVCEIVSEWFAVGAPAVAEMRAGIRRSRIAGIQRLHHHAHGAACVLACEDIEAR